MTIKIYASICLALTLNLVAFSQQGKQKRADALFNKFAFVKAAEVYEKLIEKNYNAEYALRKLGDCYALLRDPKKAAMHYKKAMEQNNVPISYYYKYAQALRGIKQYDESRLWLKRYIDSGGIVHTNNFSKDANFVSNIFSAEQQYFLDDVPFNSKYSDFGAIEHGQKIYFTSSRDQGVAIKRLYGWNEQPFLDVYVAEVDPDGTTHQTKKLLGDVNTKFHDGPISITKDGSTMYFSRNNFLNKVRKKDGDGLTGMKIYRATLQDGKWTNIEELSINSDDFSTQHPALNSDDSRLYYTSDRPGGFGGSDIYYVDIYDDGTLGTPQNLGNIINTPSAEGFPFVNNENILFFASEGHVGLGMLDIFATVRDKNNEFTDVINMGVPVNSHKDDFSFTMNPSGITGYFASNRDGGVGDDDIYVYHRKPILKVQGTVSDAINLKPIAQSKVTLFNDMGAETAYLITDENGYYQINIDRNKDYKLVGSHEKYIDNFKTFSSKNIAFNTTKIEVDILLDPIQDVVTLAKLNTIYFDFDKYNIREDAALELDKIVHLMLNEYPEMSIRIESHTDSRGALSYNDKLSMNRAKSTYNYLVSKGINPSRITEYQGFGERQLVNNCDDSTPCKETEHQQNRRTQFIVIRMQ
ncbi:flagellar motor protein MotB [Oceanihabitans sp. IOP_32]|uniref:OmpA family protein n=1 Tax=Oceanihabitans sp. IOP_32 TaxID=2529032 RepID=UPI001293ED62|nr:OmpA family protein [Oceanihabitans sp. IOP_32]QFZ55586.1 flagellar motor protein MotB [Oceanihabitans sp. IOP_32]